MEKFTPSELCADIKIYDYKKKVKYDEKSLVIFEKTGKMITAAKEFIIGSSIKINGKLESPVDEDLASALASLPVRKRC